MFEQDVKKILGKYGIKEANLEIPPDPKLGDYAFPCFNLSKELKKSPADIAKEFAQKIKAEGIVQKVKAIGPYVNFFIKPEAWAKEALKNLNKKPKLPKSKVMIEYSQPNTHKAFHVGHLRGTSLGESLSRILRFAGKEVVQTNYSGDTGAHIAKWLWYYITKDKSEAPKDLHELEKWIASIYVSAIKHLADNPDDEEKVNEVLRKLEKGEDKELTDIYNKTRQYSIDAFNEIYKDLHAHFDYWFFESEVEERGKKISEKLVKKGIAIVNDGATLVDLDDVKLGMWILLRQDGTALYSAKDLALAEAKFNKYNIDDSVYVVGHAQEMHFRQLFETLKRMGFRQAENCAHLSFAEVRLPTGKMSSRTGDNILYSDMRKEISEYAKQEIKKRRSDWPDDKIEEIASQVVVAALKYDMLAINPNKNIVFDPKKATEFEGETGPYLQYTHARACSILRKAGFKPGKGESLTHEKEQELIKLLSKFISVVEKSAIDYAPAHLANYTMLLAKTFNSFYHDCPVLDSKNKEDRLALVSASVKILNKCLELLAVDAPEEM